MSKQISTYTHCNDTVTSEFKRKIHTLQRREREKKKEHKKLSLQLCTGSQTYDLSLRPPKVNEYQAA